MAAPAPFDPGLQPERTAMAWRRTALALAVGPLVGARLLAPDLGALTAVVALLGMVVGVTIGAAASSRHRRVHRVLTSDAGGDRLPGAGLLLLTAVVTAFGGVAALTLLVERL
ncbi:DUF202 domain-containing protein [Cellulomonas fimi]|uniref:DUF202 domain-containing protein n=1 Tax=Cellulomonas fimi TaxID=1708 RepID=A0A7Y0QG57_CELFI|nr:DUF202 domain-containing protein [Cellulomonas fimi]NMR18753.1 DUF202 domain-containing protein [Cellulomonas fimi]